MLSRDENEILTRVGPGTPMGRFLRQYWIPAATTEEIPVAAGAPVRVRLLGEPLIIFRDPTGKVGLVGEHCPHRGASLFYARNELGGLRCLYHGWKIAHDGMVVDTPAEPAPSAYAGKFCHIGYPTVEAGGIVWAYLGAADRPPPFPRFPWLDLPESRCLVVKMRQDNNFLQGVEGDLDPAHPNYLHRDFAAEHSWDSAGWKSIALLMQDGAPVIECETTPHLMRIGAIRKTPDSAVHYVRVYEWVAPFYTFLPTGPDESKAFKAWLPIDDHSCFTFYIHYDFHRALDRDAIYANWGHRTAPPDYRTPHTLANHHFQDRNFMLDGNYSGIRGAAIQDRAVQESMGPIFDRGREHLGVSDKAVVFYRRLLLQQIRGMEEGKPLPAQDPALSFDLNGASIEMPAGRPWQEAAMVQHDLEQRHELLAEGAK